jgi:MshEN domain
MSKRLGEALMERGRITADQLEFALRNQLMLGGHLGTCLIELGFTDEDTIGFTLSALLRVPYATRGMLADVPEGLIRLLDKRVVEECRVVPFEAKNRSLDVAMVNPRDLPMLDEIAFASGMKIVPWVAPEVRIVEAMERYYDIPRRVRYVAICRSMDRVEFEKSRQKATGAPPAPPVELEPRQKNPPAIDVGTEFGYGRSWVEIADELAAKDPSLQADYGSDGDADAEPPADLEGLAERLCRANGKDDIARVVLDFATRDVERVALLAVRGDEARLWDARGIEIGEAADAPLRITTDGILGHVSGQEHYRGPLGPDPLNLRFYAWLGIDAPVEILLVPIHLNDRLVAILYGDGAEGGRIEGETEDYVRLARMLGLALNAVILKKKIRGIGSLADPHSRG